VIPSSQEHLAYTCDGDGCKVIIFIVSSPNRVRFFHIPEFTFGADIAIEGDALGTIRLSAGFRPLPQTAPGNDEEPVAEE
jgi:hypothetical protein